MRKILLACLLLGCQAKPASVVELTPAERAALSDTLVTLFDSLSAIHTTHPDSALLTRMHPAGDSVMFVEGGKIERFTGDSLVRRVLAMHVPVSQMNQRFTQRSAMVFDQDNALVTAAEEVNWNDSAGSHEYHGVLSLVLMRVGDRWVIRRYQG